MKMKIKIQPEDFSLDAEVAALTAEGDPGAIASFTGHVRREGDLSALTLEHYPHMTENEIARMVAEAESRWPLSGVTVIHRVGRLAPGERIVLVAVASSHRQAAFQACEFLMDYLKTHAPFWKEEDRGDRRHWVEARASDDEAAQRWRK
jgi:molybdopterin synthase catalytic subunit